MENKTFIDCCYCDKELQKNKVYQFTSSNCCKECLNKKKEEFYKDKQQQELRLELDNYNNNLEGMYYFITKALKVKNIEYVENSAKLSEKYLTVMTENKKNTPIGDEILKKDLEKLI